jgi:PAS domain S-box-containing protein
LRFTISSAIKHAKLSQQLQQSEEHLRQTQRFIERIAETTPGIVYVYDLVERRNIYINPQITKLLGYSPQTIQALGTELITQLMHPDDFARLSIAFQQFDTVKNGEIIENEYRIRHANGEWRWFSSRDTVFIRHLRKMLIPFYDWLLTGDACGGRSHRQW